MNERVLAKNKTSVTPPQAAQASSPLLRRPLTEEVSESVGSNSNISKELGGIQPKTIRRSLNWQNITVEAPHRSSASSTSPGGIQRLETSEVKEQEESKEDQNKELVQTKLTVGAPGDKYEQEADSMAAKVMTMPDSAIQQQIQRQAGEETEAVQMQPLVNSITPLLQRSSGEQEEVQRSDEKQAESKADPSKAQAEARGTLESIRELLNKKENAKLKGEFLQRLRELDKGWAKNSEELEGIAGDSELEEIVTDEFKGITEKAKALESEIQDKLPKAAEAPPYVQGDRPAFDEETFLADSSKYIKTKKTFQGRAIYKDTDGCYYHVDNLHRGEGSEIEYYNSQGVHLGTLKPDGTPKGDAVKGRYLFD